MARFSFVGLPSGHWIGPAASQAKFGLALLGQVNRADDAVGRPLRTRQSVLEPNHELRSVSYSEPRCRLTRVFWLSSSGLSVGVSGAYSDPTVDTISPWLWLPATLLVLAGLLWYSLKRDHFVATYYRALT